MHQRQGAATLLDNPVDLADVESLVLVPTGLAPTTGGSIEDD